VNPLPIHNLVASRVFTAEGLRNAPFIYASALVVKNSVQGVSFRYDLSGVGQILLKSVVGQFGLMYV
jgi:hypothetical protein